MPGRRGSLNIDDEGQSHAAQRLIEDGVLRGYMQDSLNARLMGVPVTGNGRRESFAHVVMPRMTNTYMLNGDKDPQDIIKSVKKGLYAVNFGRTGRHHNGNSSSPLRGFHDRGRESHLPGEGPT